MKYKNAAIVCAAAGCLFILLAVVCGGAVRWCAMAAALVCLGYLAVQYALRGGYGCPAQTKRRKMLHPGKRIGRRLKKEISSGRYTAAVSSSQSKSTRCKTKSTRIFGTTLECIRSEAILQDCENIARMSHALASFFATASAARKILSPCGTSCPTSRTTFYPAIPIRGSFLLDIQVEDGDDELLDCLCPR